MSRPQRFDAARRRTVLAIGAAGLGALGLQAKSRADARVIDIVAKKFEYLPAEIALSGANR